jgi:hypothetical protein
MKEWYFSQLRGFKPVVRFKFDIDDDNAGYQKEWIVTKVAEGKNWDIVGLTKVIQESPMLFLNCWQITAQLG